MLIGHLIGWILDISQIVMEMMFVHLFYQLMIQFTLIVLISGQ